MRAAPTLHTLSSHSTSETGVFLMPTHLPTVHQVWQFTAIAVARQEHRASLALAGWFAFEVVILTNGLEILYTVAMG